MKELLQWKEVKGRMVRFESGSKLGVLNELYLSEAGGRILLIEAAPPRLWLLLKGELLSKPIIVPTDMAEFRDGDIVVPDEFEPDRSLQTEASRLARLTKLFNTEVYAGRGWRIGRLVNARIDIDSWTLEELEVDAYPEYLISSGAHSWGLPKGFPPISRVSVRGDRAEFKPADRIEKNFSVVLTVEGTEIEESLIGLLKDLGNRTPTHEEQTELVQEAIDRAYQRSTQI